MRVEEERPARDAAFGDGGAHQQRLAGQADDGDDAPEDAAQIDVRVERPFRRQHRAEHAQRHQRRAEIVASARPFACDERRAQHRQHRVGVVQHQRRGRVEVDDREHEPQIQPRRPEYRKEKDPHKVAARDAQLRAVTEEQPRPDGEHDDHHAREDGGGDRHAGLADQFGRQRRQAPEDACRARQ